MKIRGEYYNCDFLRYPFEKSFSSLKELEDWIFNQPHVYEKYGASFPDPELSIYSSGPSRIEIKSEKEGYEIWIYIIEIAEGIIFSSGEYTNYKKHWNADVKKWLTHCIERRKRQDFKFV